MSALKVSALRAGYGDSEVLRGVNVSVEPGEIVALLGVNGAGKSTFVRAIAGLIPARNGSVWLGGVDVTKTPTHLRIQRGLGVVTDTRALCSALTVAENLRLAVASEDDRLRVETWLPMLSPMACRVAGTLSGGEQAVVALARALVARSEVLIVDELSAGLAPAVATTSVNALRAAAREWGTAVVVVEQATQLALAAADRAVVLSRGRVVLEGAAADLAQRRDVVETAYLGDD